MDLVEQVKKIWPSINDDISDTKTILISRAPDNICVSGWGGLGYIDTTSLSVLLEYLRSKNKYILWWLKYSNIDSDGKNLNSSEAIKNITNMAKNGDALIIDEFENFTNWLEDLLETLKCIRFNEITICRELDDEDLRVISQVTRAKIRYKINGKFKNFEPED